MTELSTEYCARVVASAEVDIIVMEDGFRYYAPGNNGALSSEALRAIADELDSRNAEWQAKVDEISEPETPDELVDHEIL